MFIEDILVPGSTLENADTMGGHSSSPNALIHSFINQIFRDYPGGAVVKNPPANAGDMASISGPGRSHMPQGN